MAVGKKKTRIIFTLPRSQAEWLEHVANKLEISKSKLIRWLIEKNVNNLKQWEGEHEYDALVKIIKTPWIKTFEDVDDDDIL